MNTTDLKNKFAKTTDAAKETAAAAMDMASETGRSMKDSVQAQASEAMDGMREAAGERAEAARDSLVGAADRLAETLHAEAKSTEGVAQRVLGGLADGVSTVSDGMRGRSLGDLLADAQGYARRNPGTFAVGAAVAGFALARFLRSSSIRQGQADRAMDATDRLYRDAARRSVDTLAQGEDRGWRA